MTPIADFMRMPERRLRVHQQFTLHNHEQLSDVIRMMKEKSARSLAQKIVEDKSFFRVVYERDFGTVSGDCIVMTDKELADLMQRQFQAGLRHANGFMPPWEAQ